MSNLDPKEISSFADLVAKMNSIESGQVVKSNSNHISEGLKANDMGSILENMYRGSTFESAKGLPAEYDMPNQSPVLGRDEEKNVYGDYFVGEDVDIEDKGEYDQEGDMAKGDLNRAADAALELESILSDSDNLPEWVQAKITKALDYLDTARDYMKNELEEMGTSLLILHPGWVETDMGGPNAPLSKGESVRGIMQRIAEQNMSMSGRFVQFDGTPIEW